MARYGRRRKPGPSKNEKKVQRRGETDQTAAAPLERVFPALSRLSIKLVFTDARGAAVKEESLDLGPGDACSLAFACPGVCGVGKFNLTARIERAVLEREVAFEATAPCGSPRYGTVNEPCGSTIKCTVNLTLSGTPAAG